MSKSAALKSIDLSAQPLENQPYDHQAFELTAPSDAPSWKQEVNQRLAAHRTRRGGSQGENDARAASTSSAGTAASTAPNSATGRAAEAAARVAARYAKAPSYKQLLAGEARAVVRAAGAAAEAARNAQAAAQAVLTGLEFGPAPGASWEQETQSHAASHLPGVVSPGEPENWLPAEAQPAPARWLDEPPVTAQLTAAELAWMEYEAVHGPQHMPKPRWEEALPTVSAATAAGVGQDEWSEMRLYPAPQASEQYRSGQIAGDNSLRRRQDERDGHDYSGRDSRTAGFDLHDPIGQATVQPVQHIAANLIEFPKELVATRKARPRQVEGPYYDASKESPQLNIFEVDPELLAPPIVLSDTMADVAPPEWASIKLDHRLSNSASEARNEATEERAYPQVYDRNEEAGAALHAGYAERYQEPVRHERSVEAKHAVTVAPIEPAIVESNISAVAQRSARNTSAAAWESIAKLPDPIKTAVVVEPMIELFVAPLSDRILAAVIDGALVTLAFFAAAMVVVASTSHPPAGRIALIATVCGLLLFGMLYQFLFFSYAEEGTPGMRYARVALCSFDDDNPTRKQMRKRIPAFLISVLPIGLGLAWAFIDGDSLALHDRLTRTYQRKY